MNAARTRGWAAALDLSQKLQLGAACGGQPPALAALYDQAVADQLRLGGIAGGRAIGHHPAITPAVVDQRLGAGPLEIDHLAKEDRMIAALVLELGGAAEARRTPFETRSAFRPVAAI